jgi:hypothetical protein
MNDPTGLNDGFGLGMAAVPTKQAWPAGGESVQPGALPARSPLIALTGSALTGAGSLRRLGLNYLNYLNGEKTDQRSGALHFRSPIFLRLA